MSPNPNKFFYLVNTININDNDYLCSKPTLKELKEIVFAMKPTKALGHDGFPAMFYQKGWDTLHHDILCFTNCFFENPDIIEQCNATCLCLIHKKWICEYPTNFRPISLTNVIHKIISKLLSSRLKPVLQSIICDVQGAFIKGIQISSNIIVAKEATKRIKNYFALKLGMSKAFDKIEWPFLMQALKGFVFD